MQNRTEVQSYRSASSTLSLMYLLCLTQAIDLTLSFISMGNAWLSAYRDYQAVNWHSLELAEHSVDQRETENFIAQQLQKTQLMLLLQRLIIQNEKAQHERCAEKRCAVTEKLPTCASWETQG